MSTLQLIFYKGIIYKSYFAIYYKMKKRVEKQTKIVATVAHKIEKDFIEELYLNGADVLRLNTAHMTVDDARPFVKKIREVSENIAILVDTKGPEIRTSGLDNPLTVKQGDFITVSGGDCVNTQNHLCVDYNDFARDVEVDNVILIDDGEIELLVVQRLEYVLKCEVLVGGTIKNRKSVNVPNVNINLPSLTKKDIDFIHFAAEEDIDFIAHSFVRNKQDVLDVQRILDEKDSKIKIIAKIENQQGVDNIDEILDHVYGIMVARGDLGIEIPASEVPGVQKHLIHRCVEKRKRVIVATQMLHTMIDHPYPTRAEISDVANAIFDGADAIMLSGETAYGKYPLHAIKTMVSVAQTVDQQTGGFMDSSIKEIADPVASYLSKAAVMSTLDLPVKAIVCDTMTGRTSRYLSAFKGHVPIYSICYNKRTMRELMLCYGVHPFYLEKQESIERFIEESMSMLCNVHIFDADLIAVVAGNFGITHGASFLEISEVRNFKGMRAKLNEK